MRTSRATAALSLLSATLVAALAADETCDQATTTWKWQDDNEGPDLSENLARELAEVYASDLAVLGCEMNIEAEGKLVHVLDFAAQVEEQQHEDTFWVGLNGASEGILVRPENPVAACLATLAEVAAAALLDAEASKNSKGGKKPLQGSEIYEPKRILSATGKPVFEYKRARELKILHVLLDRQAWVWPAVKVGFSRRIGGTELLTVSDAPRVLLAKDMVSEEDAKNIIDAGSENLFRSPEKHYSDDPKYKNYRTSETGNLNDSHAASHTLRRRAWNVLRLQDLEMVEHLQLLRYTPGKWYKEHFDVFHTIPSLTKEDELVKLGRKRRDLVKWAELQRFLLWRVYSGVVPASDKLMLEKMHLLYLRPDSRYYPSVENKEFELDDYEGEVVDVHIFWLEYAFCSDKEDDDETDACIIRAAEILDEVMDMSPNRPKQRALMRNRHVTMLPYLTQVDEGGETVFPQAKGESLFGSASGVTRDGMAECSRGVIVPPIKGGAAVFYHLDPSMESIDQLSIHGGCPPVRGVKYAINIFCWNLPNGDGLRLMRSDASDW